MEIANKLETGLIQGSQELSKSQNNFLESTLGKLVNTGLNVGIRALLPNVIEDQVIEIKDAVLNSGFKEGVNQAIKSAIDLGKSALRNSHREI